MALYHLHPLTKVDLLLFVDDFHPKTNRVLNREAFVYALTCSPHLSFSDPLSMVYELLRDCFVPNDSINGFDVFLRYASTLLMVMCLH
jgi:hypothetical protein